MEYVYAILFQVFSTFACVQNSTIDKISKSDLSTKHTIEPSTIIIRLDYFGLIEFVKKNLDKALNLLYYPSREGKNNYPVVTASNLKSRNILLIEDGKGFLFFYGICHLTGSLITLRYKCISFPSY